MAVVNFILTRVQDREILPLPFKKDKQWQPMVYYKKKKKKKDNNLYVLLHFIFNSQFVVLSAWMYTYFSLGKD